MHILKSSYIPGVNSPWSRCMILLCGFEFCLLELCLLGMTCACILVGGGKFSFFFWYSGLCDVVYFGVCVGLFSADYSFCVFILLVVWIKCAGLDGFNSWVIPVIVYRCWSYHWLIFHGVWSSLAVWDLGFSVPTSVVQVQLGDQDSRSHLLWN